MRTLLEHIERRTTEYAQHPLFAHMKDESVPAEQRLRFVPSLAHFVMSFADLYAMVLREEPAKDRYQELVNAHTYEDGGHWKWFLIDLRSLGYDPMMNFTDSLRIIWGERTAPIRMLTYHMTRLGLGATSLEKFVLVNCIEAGGKVALGSAVPAAESAARRLKSNLIYFGAHHIKTEMQHTVEDAEVKRSLELTVIDDSLRPGLVHIVEQSFAAFAEFARGVLAISDSSWPPSGKVAAQ